MNNEITIIRNKEGKVIAGAVTKSFRENANIFGTAEYEMWQKFISRHANAKMKLKAKKRSPKRKTYAKHTYERMRDFISTQPNKEELLKEMDRIIALSKIHTNPYRMVLDWFLAKFENTPDYKLVFNSESKSKKIISVKTQTAVNE